MGSALLIHGVRTRPELNGKICRLLGPHNDTRLEVEIEGERIAMKANNLTLPDRSPQNHTDVISPIDRILPMEWGASTEAAVLEPFIKAKLQPERHPTNATYRVFRCSSRFPVPIVRKPPALSLVVPVSIV